MKRLQIVRGKFKKRSEGWWRETVNKNEIRTLSRERRNCVLSEGEGVARLQLKSYTKAVQLTLMNTTR